MKKLNIPEGYQTVMPYLIVKNATAFQQFMQEVFGATEKMKYMRSEDVVMHAEISVGDCTIMFADATESFDVATGGFFIYVESADDTYNRALAKGGTSVMELVDKEYGRSGGIKDPFGNVWWITSSPV